MASVELDRQSIEKRDFPIGRRGYDPAAVDAHLRALATEVEELRRVLEHRAGETLGSTAGTQVQGILEAAEATAADIERKAAEDARLTRAQADSDAKRTRADAVQRAQTHVAAVAKATSVLSERVESLDGETGTLVDSLRAGASRLAADLSSVETSMADLYDAAAGRAGQTPQADPPLAAAPVPGGDTGADAPVRQGHSEFVPAPASPVIEPPVSVPSEPSVPSAAEPPVAPPAKPPLQSPEPSGGAGHQYSPSSEPANGEDLDGARLIALNMALNGESRVATDRYLAEHYELADRHKLLDEVYAAIEG
jgi:hypothetical protein